MQILQFIAIPLSILVGSAIASLPCVDNWFDREFAKIWNIVLTKLNSK